MNRTIAAPLRPGALRPPTRRRPRAHPRGPPRARPASCGCSPTRRSATRPRSGSASPWRCRSSPCSPRPPCSAPRSTTARSSTCSSKPVSRHVIAVSKYAAAWAATMVLGALPLAPRRRWSSTRREPRRAVALGVGAAVAGTVYTALFLGLAALTRHAVVVGLLFVLLWEGVLGVDLRRGALARDRRVGAGGRRRGQPGSWTRRRRVSSTPSSRRPSSPSASLWFTGDRLRSFTLRGDE